MAGRRPGADDWRTMTKILIVGGGVAALEAALALQELAPELVGGRARGARQLLRLPAAARDRRARTFPLQRLTDGAGATLRQGIVTRVDAERHVVHTAEGEELPFDLLLLAPGAVPDRCAARRVVLPWPGRRGRARADGRGRARGRGRKLRLRRSERRQVGAAALRARAAHAGAAGRRGRDRRPGHRRHARGRAARAVRRAGERGDRRAARGPRHRARSRHDPARVRRRRACRSRPAARSPQTAPWRCRNSKARGCTGSSRDRTGFLPTDPFGQVHGEIDVWAAGDATSFPLKQGGIAAQQADAAAESIAARAGAKLEPSPFRPVLRGPAADRDEPALPAGRGQPRGLRGRHRAALVAAGQDRRPLPGARSSPGTSASPSCCRTRRASRRCRSRSSSTPAEHGVWSKV